MHLLPVLIVVVALLLVPTSALAWGPAAHLDLSLAVLGDLTLLAPALAALLKRYRDDFLYGSLAADITIGKNLAPYQLHCHNWQVAFSVLDLAKRDDTRAFAWGYLSHLAADVVAHNYFVPYKTVEHYQRRGAAHTYWELRFDAHVSREAWQEGRRLSTRAFAAHDAHLRDILTGPLFPFGINKQLFRSMVLFSRLKRWRQTAEAHTRRSRRVLTDEEWNEARQMSIDRIRDLLNKGPQAACLQSDPTGHRNLLIARNLRQRLRQLRRQKRLKEPSEVGRMFKPLFREAIESKLNLPPLSDLIEPGKPEKTRRRIRGLLSSTRPNGTNPRRARRRQTSLERRARRQAQRKAKAEARTARAAARAARAEARSKGKKPGPMGRALARLRRAAPRGRGDPK